MMKYGKYEKHLSREKCEIVKCDEVWEVFDVIVGSVDEIVKRDEVHC